MAIVLLFSDSAPLAFPHSTNAAAQVVSTYGSVFAKDVIYNRGMQIVNKANNAAASATNYTYARAADGTVSEIARNIYSIDSASTSGTYSVATLRKNGTTTTIDTVMTASHEGLVVNATSSVDPSIENQTNIDYNGVSFSTDSSCIYFGSQSQFRFRFGNGDGPGGGNSMYIEYKAADSSYQVAQQFTDRTG